MRRTNRQWGTPAGAVRLAAWLALGGAWRDAEGSMLIGQTDRGWSSLGRKRYGIQRIRWTGETPFEIHELRATPDGFELTFTEDVDTAAAVDPGSYAMTSYTYEYHKAYGSDEMETQTPVVREARMVDARTVRLVIDGMRSGGEGYVHELHTPGVRNAAGESLLHDVVYYTVQRLPGGS